MPKKRASKPGISKATPAGKTIKPRGKRAGGIRTGESGDGERDDRSAGETAAGESVATLDGPESGAGLTPGWAEALGHQLGRVDIDANGKSTKKVFTRSVEMRMKMKLAQRARRAREHQGVR